VQILQITRARLLLNRARVIRDYTPQPTLPQLRWIQWWYYYFMIKQPRSFSWKLYSLDLQSLEAHSASHSALTYLSSCRNLSCWLGEWTWRSISGGFNGHYHSKMATAVAAWAAEAYGRCSSNFIEGNRSNRGIRMWALSFKHCFKVRIFWHLCVYVWFSICGDFHFQFTYFFRCLFWLSCECVLDLCRLHMWVHPETAWDCGKWYLWFLTYTHARTYIGI